MRAVDFRGRLHRRQLAGVSLQISTMPCKIGDESGQDRAINGGNGGTKLEQGIAQIRPSSVWDRRTVQLCKYVLLNCASVHIPHSSAWVMAAASVRDNELTPLSVMVGAKERTAGIIARML